MALDENKTGAENKTGMRTALRRVRGLGSAKDGTGNFWRLRVTSVALVPLSLFAIGFAVSVAGRSYADTRATLAQPLVALLIAAFVLVSLDHMRHGMKDIFDDYIHGELLKPVIVMLNDFFTVGLGAICIFALLKIAFGA